MDISREDSVKNRLNRVRLLSIIGGIVVIVVGSLIFFNMSASKANGADSKEVAAEESGDNTADENGADAEGNEEGEEDEKAPVPVEVTEVASGSVSSYISSSANLVAEFQVTILSEVEGRVARLYVEEGDFVRKGQVLANLVRDDAEIALTKAQLKETNARLAYERGKDLSEKELLSREEFDKFTMDFEIARQEQAEAEWRLEKTTFRAPFSGKISERMIQVGQNIRPGDELFQLTDLDPLIARIFLPERDIIGLEEGREVKIVLNAAQDTVFDGRIRQISPIVDTATGTVKVTIEAADPPASVRPGSFVTVNIVRETHLEATVIPREAVLRELQSAHVFIVEDDVATKRDITLGLEEGLLVESLSGLELGEQVIIAGQGGLRDGAKVKILGLEPEEESDSESDETPESEADEQPAE
jgi:membrane fusion protein (multidrug efflux system)